LKEKVVLKKSISEMLQNDYLDKLKIKL
jgi:hypothetical protein